MLHGQVFVRVRLVEEANEVPVRRWGILLVDDGRASPIREKERPSWVWFLVHGGFWTEIAGAPPCSGSSEGGGEVLAGRGAENFPPKLVAPEGWPPNLAKQLPAHPLGAAVVDDPDEATAAFRAGASGMV